MAGVMAGRECGFKIKETGDRSQESALRPIPLRSGQAGSGQESRMQKKNNQDQVAYNHWLLDSLISSCGLDTGKTGSTS
jgi:hypothetical protein